MGPTISSRPGLSKLPPPILTGDPIGRSYTIIWCDPTIGMMENALDDSNTIARLTKSVNRKRQLIHTFREMQPCRDFLNEVNNYACLIVSGSMGEKLVPMIHNRENVHVIYVFCLNRAVHELWAKNYRKVRGVFTKIDDICNDLKTYFISNLSLEYDQLQIEIFSRPFSLPITNPQEISFVYSLAMKMLLSNNNSSKDDLVEYCREQFTNDYQIRSIKDLEQNFVQHDILWWFTKDKFFQEIINLALSTHDLYTLYSMNFMIKSLERRLENLQPRVTPVNQPTNEPLILYFSQTMSPENLQQIRNNQGGLMCIDEFLFAYAEHRIVTLLVEGPTKTPINPKEINVVFHIQIPANIEANVPYAHIGNISRYAHQKEYLFGMSSVFRINHIESINDVPSAWTIHLSLLDRNDSRLLAIKRGINEDFLHEEYDLVEASSTLQKKLSVFKVTRKFIEQIPNLNLEQIRSILRHYNFATIHSVFGDFDRSIEEFRSAINLIICPRSDRRNDNHICLIPFYSSLGVTLQENNNSVDSFLEAYRALTILGKNREHSLYTGRLADAVHFNLGWIKEQQNKLDEAKIFYHEALKFRTMYLSDDHPDRIQLENRIENLDNRI